jgi:competence protein ComEA
MKATLVMAILSFICTSSPIQAATKPNQIINPTEQSQTLKSGRGTINLNTADAKTLSKSVKGIGIKRAEAIVKYRETHGKFQSVSDLSDVPGLGKNFVMNNMDKLQETFSVN